MNNGLRNREIQYNVIDGITAIKNYKTLFNLLGVKNGSRSQWITDQRERSS